MVEARPELAGLIVVGGSVGGLVAAVLAADRGCRSVVLERHKEPGGAAATEPEAVAAAGTRFQRAAGVDDSAERFLEDILATTLHHVDTALASALAHESAALVEWLADRCGLGVELIPGSTAGHSAVRRHTPGTHGGAMLVTALARVANRHPRVSVRAGVAVEDLARDASGAVTGVTVRSARRVPQALSGPVLLACGGFAAADALVSEHCPAAAGLPYFGWSGAVGEALRLGHEAGAATRRLEACAVTPFLALPAHLAVTAPLVELGAIVVNQGGHRFVAEDGSTAAVAAAVRAQPGRMAYLLFDDRIATAARAADPFFANVVLPRTGRRADKLEELAKQFEIEPASVRLTVDTYNANLELGGDPFGRETGGGPLGAPVHAIRVTAARLRTLGGLAVDAGARVLDAAGHPIPGLYAAGGATAGLGGEGPDGGLAGTEALVSLGLGRLAALQIATAGGEPASVG